MYGVCITNIVLSTYLYVEPPVTLRPVGCGFLYARYLSVCGIAAPYHSLQVIHCINNTSVGIFVIGGHEIVLPTCGQPYNSS